VTAVTRTVAAAAWLFLSTGITSACSNSMFSSDTVFGLELVADATGAIKALDVVERHRVAADCS
jgi:hypothetical protein